jgi:hypothetical protein
MTNQSLDKLPAGRHANVVNVIGSGPGKDRITRRGLVEGKRIKMVREVPSQFSAGLFEIHIEGNELTSIFTKAECLRTIVEVI